MPISAEERSIIEQTLAHAEAGTTNMLPELMHAPVTRYTDPKQLEQEINVLFRNFPIIVAHSSELAEPGDFLTHDATGMPILVTRNRDGQVRAFLNVCRHRGARLKNEPCGKAKTFSCPYHSWTFDLDGNLRGMPQAYGFEGVDKSKLGLKELPVHERFGLIWVVPTPQDKPVDFDTWLKPMEEQLESLSLDTHVVYRKWSLDRDMN